MNLINNAYQGVQNYLKEVPPFEPETVAMASTVIFTFMLIATRDVKVSAIRAVIPVLFDRVSNLTLPFFKRLDSHYQLGGATTILHSMATFTIVAYGANAYGDSYFLKNFQRMLTITTMLGGLRFFSSKLEDLVAHSS